MPIVHIAGGGIAGLVAGIVFARRGWQATIHERSPELRANGNGFPIFENGLRILEALGLGDRIESCGHRLERWSIYRSSGEKATEYEPFDATGGRIVMFHRQALVDLLVGTAQSSGVTIMPGSRIVGADSDGAILLEGDRRIEADLVVGADGIRSAVRRAVMGDLPLGAHRKGALRLLIPIEPGDFPDGNTRVGREFNDPSGRRIGLLPCSPTLMYMILVNLLTDPEAGRQPVDVELWSATFPMLRRYIERIGEGGHYDVYHSIFPPAWSAGRCALVGDAAHGMTPALGQGANTAMMTAYALAASVSSGLSPQEDLREWERRLRPLVDFTQKYAEGITSGRLDPNNEIFFSDPGLRRLLEADIPAEFGAAIAA
ncbi:FAD-dependent oxidoreductase [Enterovirga rhinocerotis]|uniref:2-polyprenyl-6-methoxyphenol hydroxylase-like FAD-dependent oxidoreductase n=1 Tax=Enterovirga rhinocerotis TaxID=1339210 RepID=A0A4R7C821_9HYPH|nr:NAD(P)/FAD-dependent oxidoreductase [Enterovirga rhinocerotis]TDR92986.1 2-polyprenyl-6-methoxyphenol hydroxylase-like FAD-dependent oxidoreductase [Enterovirga rhinocerotis]